MRKQSSPLFIFFLLIAGFCNNQVLAQDQNVEQLRTWLAGMQADAQALEDTLAIHRLQRAYGYYIDKGFWSDAADLFAADATLEIGVDGVYRGQQRIRGMLAAYGGGSLDTGPGLPFGQLNMHMQL